MNYFQGLFGESHVPYEIDRVSEDVAPGIVDMTRTAINFLQKNKKQGFFLLVEGGRIDHAHHENNALRALEEVVAMDEAIRTAKEMTDEEDTLIIVTADHSHAFNINGYPVRGNPITGPLTFLWIFDKNWTFKTKFWLEIDLKNQNLTQNQNEIDR